MSSFSTLTITATLENARKTVQPDVPNTVPSLSNLFPAAPEDPTWADGTVYTAPRIVTHNGKQYSVYKQSHTASPDTEPGVGANWKDEWRYYDPLPKPTLTYGGALLGDNGALWDMQNLTSHYWYAKDSQGAYLRDNISPEIFHKNFVTSGDKDLPDRNHPGRLRLPSMDIEYGPSTTINDTNHPLWEKQVAQMQKAATDMRALGFPAMFYQPWSYDTVPPRLLFQYMFRDHDWNRMDVPLGQRHNKSNVDQIVAKRMRPYVDVVGLRVYAVYPLANEDDFNQDKFLYAVDYNLQKVKYLYPDRPIFCWVQPSSTTPWTEINLATWNKFISFMYMHPDVDALMLFWLPDKPVAAGWDNVFKPSAVAAAAP